MQLNDMKAGIGFILIRGIEPNSWLATVQLLGQLNAHPRLRLRTVANGCERLRTVANGCDRERNLERTHPQPADPRVKREPFGGLTGFTKGRGVTTAHCRWS